MRLTVGTLLAVQAGVVVTSLIIPTPLKPVVLIILSILGTGASLWKIFSLKRDFQIAHRHWAELRTSLEEKMTTLEQAAMTDALTGLLNRRGGEEAVTQHIARTRRLTTAISLVLIDIDHFKHINDNHGHALGDRVLGEVASTIRRNLRSADLAIRWGGEEILVCLPDTNLSGAVRVAEKLRAAIAFIDLEARQLTITASFGCAELGEDTFEVAFARADMQMYLAKTQGRNRVCPKIDEK